MIKLFLAIALCALLLPGCLCTCERGPNPFPTIDAQFAKVATHQFGEKYIYQSTDEPQYFSLLRLWGSSYQAGFAYGALMREELRENYDNLWKYYYTLAD
jgi:hypothetical protein